MDNIISPFNIPIIQDVISEKSYLLIKGEVKEYLDKNLEYLNTPWENPTKTSLFLPPEKNFENKNIENEIKKITIKYFKEWGFLENLNLEVYGMWVNVSKKGSFQQYHKHAHPIVKNLFSGTMYIDVYKNSGDLVLINPLDGILNYLPPCLKAPNQYKISPENGLIVSFPSWMGHYVEENKNNNNRISVSWNVTIN